jgi:DNA (cytosine-5)-methyltransferase 1
MNELSLFSGYGGFSLGLKLAGLKTRTIAYCDNEPYVQEILKARIRDGYIDNAPIISDISSFDFRVFRGICDIITAGFPCQPHSHAGSRLGESDERNFWPDTKRVISEVGCQYVLLENVPGILSNGYGGTVVGELSEIGYDCRWEIISASDVGAPHLRQRWWCFAELAHSEGKRKLSGGWGRKGIHGSRVQATDSSV